MRPGSVEVVHIRVEHAVELLLMQDEQMIEALTPYTAEESLTDGIRARGGIWGFKNLNVTRLRNPSEAHPKLAVVITDEVLRPRTIGGGFPQLLCRPSLTGISFPPVMGHFTRPRFDDSKAEQRREEKIRDSAQGSAPSPPRMP